MNQEHKSLPSENQEPTPVYYLQNAKSRTLPKTIILIVLMVVSIAASSLLSSPDLFDGTLKSLDKKKSTVTKITAGATAASAAITLIPGDVGTPIAEKFADISEYSIFLFSAIFLEKYLTTASGMISFRFLIPVALLLILLSLFRIKSGYSLRTFGVKLLLFAVILYAVVPVSVMLSNTIEKTYNASTWEATHKVGDTNKGSSSDSNTKKDTTAKKDSKSSSDSSITDWLPSFNPKASAEEKIDEYKSKLNDLIDGIAVLIVTTCILPILVLVFMIWVMKILFGLSINVPKPGGRLRGAVPKIKSMRGL